MIYASLRTYRDSVTELNTLFIVRSLSFFRQIRQSIGFK